MKFSESSIPATVSSLADDQGFAFAAANVEKMANILFNASALYLKEVKNVNKPAAFVVENLDGSLIFAAVCKYHEGTDGNPGSWSLSYTFDPEDLKDCNVGKLTDALVYPILAKYATEKFGMLFEVYEGAICLFTILSKCIVQFLEDNACKATDDEPFQVVLDGIFVGTSGMEKGEVIKAIEADGSIKRLVKDDDILEN